MAIDKIRSINGKAIEDYELKQNVLTKDNNTEYTPTGNYNPVTKKYVDDKVAGIVDSAPETLDTLKELSTALGDNPNFATSVANQLGNKVDKVDGKGLSTNDLTTNLKNNYDAAYTHSTSAHAPSNAQKNSDITKAEIEAKLTGNVISHTHSQYIDDTELGTKVLTKDNTTEYTPTGDYNPVTKKYVDDNRFSGKYSDLTGAPDLTQYAPINSPDFTGDISMGRKADTEIGVNSVALGTNNTANADHSFAEGYMTSAIAPASHAEGAATRAADECSHAEGSGTISSGPASHAEGHITIASGACQHVQGKYNIEDTTVTNDNVYGTYAHIVGNGYVTADDKEVRSNAHTLDWEGNAWYAGKVTAGANPTEDMDLTTKKYVDDANGVDEGTLNNNLTNIFGFVAE